MTTYSPEVVRKPICLPGAYGLKKAPNRGEHFPQSPIAVLRPGFEVTICDLKCHRPRGFLVVTRRFLATVPYGSEPLPFDERRDGQRDEAKDTTRRCQRHLVRSVATLFIEDRDDSAALLNLQGKREVYGSASSAPVVLSGSRTRGTSFNTCSSV